MSLVVAGPPASAASARPATVVTAQVGGWEIWALHSDWCILPRNFSASLGEQVVQGGTCAPYDFVSSQAGWYHIKNRNNGLCLNVRDASTANNAQVIQYRCNLTLNNDWLMVMQIRVGGHDFYQLRNRNSQKCLNVQGGSLSPGAALIQYTCSSTARNNMFTWEPYA
ncbi:MAG TPA: RICIN domain-containing protein [Pilimelia sp.]|nr:RICIN domain-containing protein [Pilimelia sp.]